MKRQRNVVKTYKAFSSLALVVETGFAALISHCLHMLLNYKKKERAK